MRTIGELLIAVKSEESDDAKRELLVKNKGLPKFEALMVMLTDPEKEFWCLPEGVQYSTRDHVIGRTPTLMSSFKTLKYMEKPTRVRSDRLQDMFLGMMDVLHVSEAELAACIVERRELPYVSNAIIREALALEEVKTAPKVVTPPAMKSDEVVEPAVVEEDVAKQFNVVVTEDETPEVKDEVVDIPTINLTPEAETKSEDLTPKVETMTPKKKATPKTRKPRKTKK